jgi:hypothetical protein
MSELIAKLGLAGGLTAGGLAAACLLWFVLRRRLAGLRRAQRIAREATEIEDFRNTVNELLTALDQAAARVESQIQSQFERLTEVQSDVDEKLRRLTLASAVSTPVIAELVSSAQPSTQPNIPIPKARSRRASRRDETPDLSPAEPIAALRDARVDQVYQLSDAGNKPITIAESTGMLLGEVELLLALRDYR